jgi:ATP-dependent helicase/nuclease subunit B
MKVVHIAGRAGSGKSRLIFNQIKDQLDKNDGRKLILLVPEQFTLQSERDLIQSLQLPGIMQVEVLSFDRLAERILDEVGGKTRIMIDEQGRHMVLRRIIDDLAPELTIYQKVSRQDGFVQFVSTFLSELKNYNITIEMLGLVAKDLTDTLGNKLHDIALIYEHFNNYLGTRYLDLDERFNLVLERIHESTFLRNSLIWMDGFTTLTPQQLSIIHKMMQISSQLTCAYTLDLSNKCRDQELFASTRRAYDAIERLAFDLQLPQEYIHLSGEPSNRNRSLSHLQREIYAYPHHGYQGDVSGLGIFAATTIYQEVERAAAEIMRLAREAQLRWRDIVVICSDMDRYGHLIGRSFQEYGIPFFTDNKRDIMTHPLVEYILSLLDMFIKNYRPLDVLRYLKTALTDLQIDEVEILENYAITYGIKGGQWKREFNLGKDQPLEELNLWRHSFMDPVANMEEVVRQATTVGDYTAGLYDYLQHQDIFVRLEEWIDELKAQGKYEQVYEHTQIWNIVMRIFDQTVDIMGDQPGTLAEYRRILEAGFASYQLGLIPTTVDQVLIGNIEHLKSRGVKALFVLGINDGLLPSVSVLDGLLLEEERSALIEKGLELPGARQRKLEEERLSIYSMLSKPDDVLWISYARADGEGHSLRPSILIDRLTRLFPGLQIHSDVLQDRENQLAIVGPPRSTFKHLIQQMRQYLDGESLEDFWWQILYWYQQHPQWQPIIERTQQALFHRNAVSGLTSQNISAIYPQPFKSSVSRLEQFAACPFAHLVRYGLRPWERVEYSVAMPDIGELLHQCLSSFGEEVARQKLPWSDLTSEQSDVLVDSIMDSLVEEFGEGVFASSHRYLYMVERLKRMGRTTVQAVVNHVQKGDFQPAAFEVSFGLKGQFPPITVELADGTKVLLEGRVDRIDILGDGEDSYVKVIDYKTGNQSLYLDEMYHGLSLQLVVYLQAILEQASYWGLDSLKPAGIFYFHIHDPLVRTDDMIAEKVQQEMQKQFRMKGLVLKDLRLLKSMDHDIKGDSLIIPAAVNLNDTVRETSSVVAEDEWPILLNYADSKVSRLAQEIIQGNASIEPYRRDKDNACTFCPYHSICQFDPLFEGNHYRYLPSYSNDQAMEFMRRNEVK